MNWTRASNNVIESGEFRIVTVYVKGRPHYELQHRGLKQGFSPSIEAMKKRAEQMAGYGNG